MTVAEYFKGQNIFITGGSGFLGKLLIEKLLRCCSGVGNIYVLLRPKRGHSVEERLQVLKASTAFDVLRKENPDAFQKVIAVAGDIAEINLGLSNSDRQMLIENVDIIYHSAASVRFDDVLKDAIIFNVRSTREIVNLALETKHLSNFVYVSTTFCNCDRYVVEEEVYPAHANWKDAIRLAEECDEEILDAFSVSYIKPHINTYTFTKSMAENLVKDMCENKIPAIIVRPSVVINTYSDPTPGWNDTLNGPIGLVLATGKGLVRTILTRHASRCDYVPADFVVNGMLLAVRESNPEKILKSAEVYNLCEYMEGVITQEEISIYGMDVCRNTPFSQILWYPRVSLTTSFSVYYIQFILFHMVPAFIFDTIFRVTGQRAMLCKIQRKIYNANIAMAPLMSISYHFLNYKFLELQKTITEEDRGFFFKTFHLESEKRQYLEEAIMGTAKYMLHEKFDATGEKSRKMLKKYWYADMVLRTILFSLFFWIFIMKIDILNLCWTGFKTYITQL